MSRGKWIPDCGLLALALMLPAFAALAERPESSPLQVLLSRAGATSADLAPDPVTVGASPTRERQFPLFRAIMAAPIDSRARAGDLANELAEAVSSPEALFRKAGALAESGAKRASNGDEQALANELRAARDPLARSLEWMAPLAQPGAAWPTVLPGEAELPRELRFELALVVAAVEGSHASLQRAFSRLPPTFTPTLLRRQALEGPGSSAMEPDYRRWLPAIDRPILHAGLANLVAAVQRLRHYLAKTPTLPSLAWTLDTPLGRIVVDTTGRDNFHRLKDALLVLDVGGDDHYEFLPPGDSHRIAILLDHGGDDRYLADGTGADPSAAILGYGILWDTGGNDRYQAADFGQSAAVFGATLLVDEGGSNAFNARSHSQAFAIGGVALLLGGPGNDRYMAATQAQGSAGPEGVALLIDVGGDDRYTLGNAPLIAPSPQLPMSNTSLGQGAGYGLRPEAKGASGTSGGIGILLDLAGNDHYVAQVFAQGAGYHEGLGLLVDNGGDDRIEAAWYAMGAAAHQGAGVFLKRGGGRDRYRASHSTSVGAAHDFSVGVFVDEGGDDDYRIGGLGLGAAHDHGIAIFVDAKGRDAYAVDEPSCRAFGASQLGEGRKSNDDRPNIGLFMDLGGEDVYPAHCTSASNNALWAFPRASSARRWRSEAGAGIDGKYSIPFATGARAALPARSQP